MSQDFFVCAEKGGIVRKADHGSGIGDTAPVKKKLSGANHTLVDQIVADGCSGCVPEENIQIVFADENRPER